MVAIYLMGDQIRGSEISFSVIGEDKIMDGTQQILQIQLWDCVNGFFFFFFHEVRSIGDEIIG